MGKFTGKLGKEKIRGTPVGDTLVVMLKGPTSVSACMALIL